MSTVICLFFLIAGCNGSLGYWQSLATRESNKQHLGHEYSDSQFEVHAGSDGDQVPQTSSSCNSPLAVLGKSLSASVLQVWFPAHWAVRVETRLCSLGVTTSEYRAEHTQSHVPNVRCNIKLPGQSIDVEHLLQRFPTVLRGIVQGVFRQSCY